MLTHEEHAEKWSELWNSISDLQHKKEGSGMWLFYEEFLKNYDFTGKKVIELGCGTGINTIIMAKLGAKVTFLDISQHALDIVKKNAKKFGVEAEYIKGDIFDFNGNEEYDLVHSEGVVEHFLPPYRQRIIDIHAKTIKKGGKALIIVPNKACPGYVIGKYLANKVGNWVYGDEYPYTKKELERRIKRAGFLSEMWSGGEFVTSCVWFFAPIFLSSANFMKRSLRFTPGRRMAKLDQNHRIANKIGRIIGVLATKK